mmetsp:Transcript_8084/g.25305  ORF Transcript_8084/g.25305 Transcript_8084/m.25305 type:complete len:638 (-) Transcript_8084:128-2041(-)
MCGILGIFDVAPGTTQSQLRSKLIECARRMRHRGPDWSGYQLISQATNSEASTPLMGIGSNASTESLQRLCISEHGVRGAARHAIAHERLAIIDPESGAQPLFAAACAGADGSTLIEEGSIVVAANGEIYNYRELYQLLKDSGFPYEPKTGSDCEVLIPLYCKFGLEKACSLLRGMFSFIIYDQRTGFYGAARDHIGITSLYLGRGQDGSVWVASEMKALSRDCGEIEQFKPGHCWKSDSQQYSLWYAPTWRNGVLPSAPCDYRVLREAFEQAVERRMMSDVPWGVLLSGGLDSSLVASVAQRALKRKIAAGGGNQWMSRLHSFSVGLVGSPDLDAAAKAAEHIGTVHHPYTFTLQEGLDAVVEVIHHLETYDVTTIRSATPMFLMSRKIKAMGVKMVLSGEGADEILAGYLYFHKAPNKQELHAELIDKVAQLHVYDCLRANKSTMAWGVEARVPFLDADFLETAMNIDPAEKMIDVSAGRIEKYILRKAFDVPDDPYLPKDILWRQKEQFSDGVGYGWIDALRDHADAMVSDHQFSVAKHKFAYNTPRTKEAYYYRQIFDGIYPSEAAAKTLPTGKSIACSTERALAWDASFAGRADQSGRSVGVHVAAYDGSFDADSDAKKVGGAAAADVGLEL